MFAFFKAQLFLKCQKYLNFFLTLVNENLHCSRIEDGNFFAFRAATARKEILKQFYEISDNFDKLLDDSDDILYTF